MSVINVITSEDLILQRNKDFTYMFDVDGQYPQNSDDGDIVSIIEHIEKRGDITLFDCIGFSSYSGTKQLHEIYGIVPKNIKCMICNIKGINQLIVTRAKRAAEFKAMGTTYNTQCFVPLLMYYDNNFKTLNLI